MKLITIISYHKTILQSNPYPYTWINFHHQISSSRSKFSTMRIILILNLTRKRTLSLTTLLFNRSPVKPTANSQKIPAPFRERSSKTIPARHVSVYPLLVVVIHFSIFPLPPHSLSRDNPSLSKKSISLPWNPIDRFVRLDSTRIGFPFDSCYLSYYLITVVFHIHGDWPTFKALWLSRQTTTPYPSFLSILSIAFVLSKIVGFLI